VGLSIFILTELNQFLSFPLLESVPSWSTKVLLSRCVELLEPQRFVLPVRGTPGAPKNCSPGTWISWSPKDLLSQYVELLEPQRFALLVRGTPGANSWNPKDLLFRYVELLEHQNLTLPVRGSPGAPKIYSPGTWISWSP